MTKSKKTKKESEVQSVKTKSRPYLLWIIPAVVLLLVIAFVYSKMKGPETQPQSVTSDSKIQVPADDHAEPQTAQTSLPPRKEIKDLPKKITGDWYVTQRITNGKPANSALAKGSWQFYDDGSLKYTTSQYSDMGTWKVQGHDFNVTLYGHGKFPGYIAEIDAKTMTWVTTENIDGQTVSVINQLSKRK